LIAEPVYAEVKEFADVERIGELSFKGFLKPVPVLQVTGLKQGNPDLPDRSSA
jgi:hypothetical protein